jgi:hypothetical protein
VIAKYSSQILGTDVLTIYPYRDDDGVFETPPIQIGAVKHPEYMKRKIYSDDIPVHILAGKEKYYYWPRAAQEMSLVGTVGRRDEGDPSRMLYGGLTCIQHIVLRYILYYSNTIPWNYPAFLDYCADRILLRRVGGGYIFIHRLLQDYFASLDTPHRLQAAEHPYVSSSRA